MLGTLVKKQKLDVFPCLMSSQHFVSLKAHLVPFSCCIT